MLAANALNVVLVRPLRDGLCGGCHMGDIWFGSPLAGPKLYRALRCKHLVVRLYQGFELYSWGRRQSRPAHIKSGAWLL